MAFGTAGPSLGAPTSFVDLYARLGPEANPETPQAELSRLYESRRKDPGSPSSPLAGPPTSKSALDEAWEVLRDEARRKAYDGAWRRERLACALPPQERADVFRRKGNELYSAAREMMKSSGKSSSLGAVQEGLKLYKAAMQQYNLAVDLNPQDHRLFSNRAMCYLAVEDFPRCRDDAARCTELRPDFSKGWYILAKSLWQQGCCAEATHALERGLAAAPGSRELVELRAEIAGPSAVGWSQGREVGRSVSPVVTPGPSRQPTPPGHHTEQRPRSPPLVAAGSSWFARSTGGRAGSSSRSPGAASRLPCPPARQGPCPSLDASGTCLTGNFGTPTPCFADGPASMMSQPPPPPVPGQARSAYSPGPAGHGSHAGHRPASSSSRSPGPSGGGGGGAAPSSSRPSSRRERPGSSHGRPVTPGPDLEATFGEPAAAAGGASRGGPRPSSGVRRSPSLQKSAQSIESTRSQRSGQ